MAINSVENSKKVQFNKQDKIVTKPQKSDSYIKKPGKEIAKNVEDNRNILVNTSSTVSQLYETFHDKHKQLDYVCEHENERNKTYVSATNSELDTVALTNTNEINNFDSKTSGGNSTVNKFEVIPHTSHTNCLDENVNRENFDKKINSTQAKPKAVHEESINTSSKKGKSSKGSRRMSNRIKLMSRRSSSIDFKISKSFRTTTSSKNSSICKKERRKVVSVPSIKRDEAEHVNESESKVAVIQDESATDEQLIDLNGTFIHDEDESLICVSQKEDIELSQEEEEIESSQQQAINIEGDNDSGISDSEEINDAVDDLNMSQRTIDYSHIEGPCTSVNSDVSIIKTNKKSVTNKATKRVMNRTKEIFPKKKVC